MINAYHLYRLSYLLYKMKIPLLPQLIKALIFFIYNSSIPYQAEIGKGTRFGYAGIGVVIHKRAKIGENVLIGPNVTIGGKTVDGKSGLYGVPVIKNNADLGAGCKILGDITIGEYAEIGANAVVIKDVPPYGVAVGIPAHVIKIRQ